MSEIVVLNLDTLNELDLSINEFCAIWNIHKEFKLPFDDSNVNYRELQRKQYIKIIRNEKNRPQFILREKSKSLIEFLINGQVAKSKKKKASNLNVDLLTRLPEYRNKWKGLKPGSMGSLKSCKDKMIRWMQENPQYTFDDILKAADSYLESLHGDYRFLQRADYFIYKQENNREESSRLSAHIDEIDDTPNGDWTSTLN